MTTLSFTLVDGNFINFTKACLLETSPNAISVSFRICEVAFKAMHPKFAIPVHKTRKGGLALDM